MPSWDYKPMLPAIIDRDPGDETTYVCSNCGADPCYMLCPRSPHYYSAEQEREDSLRHDHMSYDEWFREGVAQYERVHGEPYVS